MAKTKRSQPLRWLRLDNAAKIYPAARRRNWSNVFRLSVSLHETVDVAVLQSVLDRTVKRFPSMAARLRRGAFWYYLQQVSCAPPIQKEHCYPLTRMGKEEMRRCAFRVIVYRNRIAVEFFHALTDGTGAMIFLKTLTAEYLREKYAIAISFDCGVLDISHAPDKEELEDCFPKYAGRVNASRKETNAWRLQGTPEPDNFLNLICFQLPVTEVLAQAHDYHVSMTAFLCAVLMKALLDLQAKKVPPILLQKPVKVQIPVNLRKLFPSKSLRNFAMYTIVEADPKLGTYEIEELCKLIHHKMGMDITPKNMGKMIATNVSAERLLAVRLLPLPIKNLIMRTVFQVVGERKSCMSFSNLGAVRVPEEMKPYVKRFDFILGVQATAPHNCGVVSYGDTVYVNFIRNIQETELESRFFAILRDLNIPVQVESNQWEREVP